MNPILPVCLHHICWMLWSKNVPLAINTTPVLRHSVHSMTFAMSNNCVYLPFRKNCCKSGRKRDLTKTKPRNVFGSSRNQRLAALKSFAKYVQIECPDEMILCQRILSIDSKKAAKPTVQYLSIQQTDILMEQPDISTPKGRRDLAMILLLYDSAARVQELCDLRICDIRLDSLPVVHLLGKGRKSRDVPLTKPCAQVLRQYICENHLDIPERRNDQLFINPQGKKLTRSGVSYVLAKYIHKANTAVDSFFPQITPHCLRHSKAMHLVEAGKNLIYIRDFLGHESIETTQVYAKANPEARRKALETMDTRMNTPAMPDWNDDPDLKAFLKTL